MSARATTEVIRTTAPGYRHTMPETPKEIAHEVVEEVKALEREAEVGESARTPAIVLSGITLVVGTIVVILLIIAFTAYYLAK
jgi:hypothetical protein